ncbi:hypothetical protein QL285_052853 [Trifolium repens]|nr:hypothetical protein QL285_052853 [Trifolium repens]
MLVDREGLWFRVLAARYGLEHGRLRAGGSRGSVWWRDVVRVRDGVGGPRDGWFGESVTRKVEDGTNTLFWSDPWLGGIPLCERFGRLFNLAETRSSTVAEMYSLGWEVGGAAWEWRRQLWVWEEEMLRECQTLLLPLTLEVDSLDRWQWRPDPVSGYSVRDAYQLLTSQEAVTLGEADDLLWHKHVPLKVSIFVWRLLRDRLLTKTNLVTRGVLSPDLDTCVTGCGGAESAQHLFLTCGTFGSLWPLVRAWIGFSSADARSLSDHFVQFTHSAGGLSARRSFLQLVCLACVWVVWNERNLRVFHNSENSVHQLLDKVKLFSYRWLKTTNITLASNTHCWWSTPLTCLGID